jgi:SOS-response transcriptional repressor LexA
MTDITTKARELISEDPALADEIRRQLSGTHLDALTQRQRECLDFIRAYASENDRAPSLATIAEAMGQASRSNVHRIVVAIESHGFIRRGASGSISIVEAA